jgi:arylsulfatase A-like enzyme
MQRHLLLMLTALFVAGSCSQCVGAGERPNLVIVVIDALRADHLGAYGYERPATPFLDELAERSVVVETTIAQSSWTKASIASMFTSLLPSQHRVLEEAPSNRLAPSLVSLPEVLQAAGYRTAWFSENSHIGPATGFDQGFDEGAMRRNLEGDASWALEHVSRWLEEGAAEGPFFLYLHLLDPHGPYEPDPELRRQFIGDLETDDEMVRLGRVGRLVKHGRLRREIGRDDVDYLRALYDAELRATDRTVSRLFDDLDRRGLLENSIVVVTSDHGEEFMEHGSLEHGHQLYEETLRVPLILSVPGVAPARIDDVVVQHIDLAPTLLELVDLAVPSQFQGRSFVGAFSGGETPAPRPVVTETTWRNVDLLSVRQGDWKLIVDQRAAKTELFHLRSDPGERNDVVAANPDVVRRLGETLETSIQPVPGVVVEGAYGASDPDVEAALRAMGYLEED